MKMNEIINQLEKEWDIPDGFFGGLREGVYHVERYDNVINLLRSIEIQGDQINRRLVTLLWFIPRFMSWQDERVLEQGGDVTQLAKATNEIESILFEKLGMP